MNWQTPSSHPLLPPDEIHVWDAPLDRLPEEIHELRGLLSTDELARADRFHFEKDRRHFTASRGLLRTILGRYLDLRPEQLTFTYSPFGKPTLAATTAPTIEFNVSHSGGRALYAFSHEGNLGIDIELVRDNFSCQEIGERFFSAAEVEQMNSYAIADRPSAFFQIWTRKEALIKAHGKGLSLPLDQFSVFLQSDQTRVVWHGPAGDDDLSSWSVHEIALDPNFRAALATRGTARINFWKFA